MGNYKDALKHLMYLQEVYQSGMSHILKVPVAVAKEGSLMATVY